MSQDKVSLVSKNNPELNQNQPANDNGAIPRTTYKTPWQQFCTDVLQGYTASKTVEDEVAELFEGSDQISKGLQKT